MKQTHVLSDNVPSTTRGCRPRQPPPNSLLHILFPFLVGWPTWIGASGPRLQGRSASAQPATVQPLYQSQEGTLPRVPRQQAVDQPSTASHDLAGHLDRRRTERRELHPQQRSFLGLVFGRMPGRYRRHQGTPSLQAPGQTGHHHIGPVAHQACPPASSAPYTPLLSWAIRFSWSQRSLAEHDLISRGHAVVGDIEEVAILLEQPHLPFVRPSSLRTTITR